MEDKMITDKLNGPDNLAIWKFQRENLPKGKGLFV